MRVRLASILPSTLAALAVASAAPAAVTVDWANVNTPGNACDAQPQGCFGSVAAGFRIAVHEVTNAQYAEFLIAVASAAALPNGADPITTDGPAAIHFSDGRNLTFLLAGAHSGTL